jgi:hypothetical protein
MNTKNLNIVLYDFYFFFLNGVNMSRSIFIPAWRFQLHVTFRINVFYCIKYLNRVICTTYKGLENRFK